jgi:hypothetical protein
MLTWKHLLLLLLQHEITFMLGYTHRAPQEHTILPLSSSFFRIRTGLWFCPLPWIFFHEMLHYSDMMDDASVALATSRDLQVFENIEFGLLSCFPNALPFALKNRV